MEEARFSISIREITFREQELNWVFAKYKHLENNPDIIMVRFGLAEAFIPVLNVEE